MEKLIDGANIEYMPGRTMECHAVVDDVEVGPKTVNLLDYFDERTAEIAAIALSRTVTDKVLARRNIGLGSTLPLPECNGYPVSRIFDFVHNKLGMEPIGRLAYVESIPGRSVAGLTDYQVLTSIVDKRNTNTYSEEDMAASPANKYLGNIFNTMSVHGVAVHELTHLAGAQDIVHFFLDPTARYITQFISQTSTLEDWPGILLKKRAYFEEGLATLVHSMYFWDNSSTPGIANERDETFETFKSPSGKRVYIPTRLSNPLTSHHEYTNCAWGIERLVELAPDTWDILMASRRYGARSHLVRRALRECIDYEVPGLFHYIDSVDVNDINATLDVTSRIDFETTRRKR